jgi:hypothetical protein
MKKCFLISPIGAEATPTREHADHVFDYGRQRDIQISKGVQVGAKDPAGGVASVRRAGTGPLPRSRPGPQVIACWVSRRTSPSGTRRLPTQPAPAVG